MNFQRKFQSQDGITKFKELYKRRSTEVDVYHDLPLYIVINTDKKKYSMIQIYRAPGSPAEVDPNNNNMVADPEKLDEALAGNQGPLYKLDTLYFLKLFWLLEPGTETMRLAY